MTQRATPGRPASERPAVRMTWSNLLFLHWRIDADQLRPLIPAELDIDTHDGSAWIALVPFEMTNTNFRGIPPMPGLSQFYECNVRTYVRHNGRAGVWFFSLDAQTLLPVLGGRWMWSLNYVHARFDVEQTGNRTDYRLTRRRWGPWPAGSTRIAWSRGEALPRAEHGSLEHFLTERHWLFTERRGRIMAGRIEHNPWPLRDATLDGLDDSLITAAGLHVSGEPLAMMSDSIDVLGYSLTD